MNRGYPTTRPELSMDDYRLAGVVEKFNRAKEQFDEFRDEIDAFVDADPKPYFSAGEFDSDTWEWIERFKVRKSFPLRFGVILGDCVHNLRSALDHLVCQVTLLDLADGSSGDGVCDQTQFPIASKGEGQFEAMADKRIPGLSPEHRALVKRIQPYHAGDKASRHALSILAELSNADKHRLVNPTYSFMASDTSEALDDLARRFAGPGRSPIKRWGLIEYGERMEHDTPWFRIEFHRDVPGPINVKVGGDPTLGIGLGQVGVSLVEFQKVAEAVLMVIQRFQAEFPETEIVD